jgi:hypothetical protein
METSQMVLYGLAGLGALAIIWFVFLAPRMKGSGGQETKTHGGVGGEQIHAQDNAKVMNRSDGSNQK